MNDPRGSLWRKWDLHVHTPASLVHAYDGADAWPQFLAELEALPTEFKVIGINDYLFIDGYRRILAERVAGRLQNIDLFLPVIEFRLDKFGGTNNHLSKVNYHVIFSDELDPDIIEQQFLNALPTKYQISPQYAHFKTKWQALATRKSLSDLGTMIIESVPTHKRDQYGTPLLEGFNNLCMSLDAITEALQTHYFEGKFLTAVGKTEWADIKWTDQSIAEKKNIINGADFVFTAANTVQQCENAQRTLRDAGVNHRLLDCSDAHAFTGTTTNKDRLGHCFTWIKADTTFAGLRQLLVEPDDRIFLGDVPQQVDRVRANPTKYLRSIEIKRKANATIDEVWFNNAIPLNPGLVAIIGNKGKGKSALADVIGLLSNTRQHEYLTFLSPVNFRQPRDNKAKHFQATITLESNTPISRGLEEIVDEKQPELVKYIPQGFLETICNQLGRIEESDFDQELKKVIFSHVDQPYRLNQDSLDSLIAYKTTEAQEQTDLLRQELHRTNEEIVRLEERAEPANRERIANLLGKKERELAAHQINEPTPVEKPPLDQNTPASTGDIETGKAELQQVEEAITAATARKGVLAQQLATADRINARLDNFQRQLNLFTTDTTNDCAEIGITVGSIVQATINKAPLDQKRQALHDELTAIDHRLDSTNTNGLRHEKARVDARIKALQDAIDEPNRHYQAYEATHKAWEQTRQSIIGDKDLPETLEYYRGQLADLDKLPDELTAARTRRLEKSKELHAVIRSLADTYRELYDPVNKFIETRALAKDKFQLNFEVGIVDAGFMTEFFELISQGVAGTFCGVESGTKHLTEILTAHDFNTEAGVLAFLEALTNALCYDLRPTSKGEPVRVSDQLRRGKTVQIIYDFLFGLAYLRPRYELRMGKKELAELSPGERGTLLLVFYLLVDKDDIPLLIDQPEENLDNQTVYELLVPCMKEAKQRRQLFIVTHNPNLAVVCDAEQVICADLQKTNKHTMEYLSGAIENPRINRAIVDILEGTMPAFDNRQDKYFR